MDISIPQKICALLSANYGTEAQLTPHDVEIIAASASAYKDAGVVPAQQFHTKIVFEGACGFANGGRYAYVLNTDKFHSYRVTVKNDYRSGTDYGTLYSTIVVSAGGKVSLSCTDSGYIPVTYYTYKIEGEEAI